MTKENRRIEFFVASKTKEMDMFVLRATTINTKTGQVEELNEKIKALPAKLASAQRVANEYVMELDKNGDLDGIEWSLSLDPVAELPRYIYNIRLLPYEREIINVVANGVMPWGQHSGRKMKDVENQYLHWLGNKKHKNEEKVNIVHFYVQYMCRKVFQEKTQQVRNYATSECSNQGARIAV